MIGGRRGSGRGMGGCYGGVVGERGGSGLWYCVLLGWGLLGGRKSRYGFEIEGGSSSKYQ